ncbi:MAG: hypothetical protein CMM50_02690 [Rhodospirillaceae bacterium]|nr:hypothetical protein [Rhodospirillaceae bacterium]
MAIAKGARALGAHRFAAWLDRRRFFVRTDVAREVEWLLYTELLELPIVDGERVSTHDGLAEEIFADPAVASIVGRALDMLGERRDDPAFEGRLTERLERYTGSRLAAADMATSLMSLAAGGIVFKQMTPGMISMGPLVAGVITQHAAISAFPLGSMIGSLWYGIFPAASSAALLVGVTGGLVAAAAAISAFSGVLTDPLLRRLGLHRRRLHRLLNVLEADMLGRGDARFVIRDHYVARLFDAVDLLRAATRLAS